MARLSVRSGIRLVAEFDPELCHEVALLTHQGCSQSNEQSVAKSSGSDFVNSAVCHGEVSTGRHTWSITVIDNEVLAAGVKYLVLRAPVGQ